VKPWIEVEPRRPHRRLAALVGLELLRIEVLRPEQPARQERPDDEAYRDQKERGHAGVCHQHEHLGVGAGGRVLGFPIPSKFLGEKEPWGNPTPRGWSTLGGPGRDATCYASRWDGSPPGRESATREVHAPVS